MASKMRLLSGRLPRVAVCYNGGFKSLSALLQRGYSDTSSSRNDPVVVFEARRDSEYESEIFAKSYEDKFGEQFRHFPLPGNVTTAQHFLEIKEKCTITAPKVASGLDQSDIMSAATSRDHQIYTLHTFAETSRKLPPADSKQLSLPSSLECAAQPCPELARKHFADLFPNRDISKGTLTVMTLAQKTEHDMSEWSSEVDQERDDVISQFVSTAIAVCESLQREGYWADFIDPTSGRPYVGPFTNATLFESDERYRHFGFSIEDLGCCKVIRHPVWGTHAFVGSIFSDAPMDSPILQKLLPQQRTVMESPSAISPAADEFLDQQSLAECGPVEQQVDTEPARVTRKMKKTAEIRAFKDDKP